MKIVIEEFLLALIFIGKWLALGLGVVGILYFAISLAYHKSYFDPRMDKFDLEISELQERKKGLEMTRATLARGMDDTDNRIEIITKDDLSISTERIEKSKSKISDLGLKWWERLPIPMLEKNETAEQAYQELKNAQNHNASIVASLEELRVERDKSNNLISGISEEIQDYEIDISEKEREKNRAQVDVKGPMIWLLSMLGLT